MKKVKLLFLVLSIWSCSNEEKVEEFPYEHTVKNQSGFDVTIKESGNTLTLKSQATGKIKSKNIEPAIEITGHENMNRDVYWELQNGDFLYLVEVYENEITYEASGTSPKATVWYRENGKITQEDVSLPWKKEVKKLGGSMAIVSVLPDNIGSKVTWKIYHQGLLKQEGTSSEIPIEGSYTIPVRFYLSRN